MDFRSEDEDVNIRKIRILQKISEDIENGTVYENKLEQLEILENLLLQEGLKASEFMKEAYTAVARECTAKYLVCAEGKKQIYIDAVERIWLKRIMSLFEKGSSLISPVLKNCAKEVNVAMYDEQVCQSLREDNTRNKALISLKRFVTEQLTQVYQNSPDVLVRHSGSEFDVSMLETVPETVHETSSESDGCKNLGNEHSNEKQEEDGDCFFDAELEPQKEVCNSRVDKDPSNIKACKKPRKLPDYFSSVEELCGHSSRAQPNGNVTPDHSKVLDDLRNSKLELLDALRKQALTTQTDEEKVNNENKKRDNTTNSGSEGNAEHDRRKEPKQNLMDRNHTAQTYEWKDSIEEVSAEIGSDEGRLRLRSPRRRVVSPLRKNQPTIGANRRRRVPWLTEETDALKEGVARFGRQWKKIKLAYEIKLARRTEVDLKDKYRVEMKKDEAFGEAPESNVWEWKAES